MPGINIHKLEDASPAMLEEAWKSSAEIARKNAGNFYYAFIFLPASQRHGIEALYAFCRTGDDFSDEIGGDKERLFEIFRERLDLCFRGLYCDKLTLSLAHAVDKFQFDRMHFDEMLEGLESDLTVTSYPTFEKLRQYCYRVASTVGLLCLKIFSCDNEASRRYAENLGIAMQLTNILRDLREDLDRGRIYIPQTDLQRFGFNDQKLFAADKAESLLKLVQFEAERAESFFSAAEAELTPKLISPLIAARIMGGIYKRILAGIVKQKKFDKRVELSRWDKMAIAKGVVAETLGR